MSVNKYKPHVYLIPEDDANRQLANGFILHDAVDLRTLQVVPTAGGWMKVQSVFETEYVALLRNSQNVHVVMIIDFDNDAGRREWFDQRIADDVKSRVFVIGSLDNAEALKRDLKSTFEGVGKALARECQDSGLKLWKTSQLGHNDNDVRRLSEIVKPIVFSEK